MANRKQELDAAIAQSKQAATEASAPVVKPAPEFKLPATRRQEAEAAVPPHPRAAKGRQVRAKELNAGMAAGRERTEQREQAGQAKVAAGEGIMGFESKPIEGFRDINKKINVRQVKKGKRQVIQSGTVKLETLRDESGKIKQYGEVKSGQGKYSSMTPEEMEAARAEAERKFLRKKKPKAPKPARDPNAPKTPRAKKPKSDGFSNVKITRTPKGGK